VLIKVKGYLALFTAAPYPRPAKAVEKLYQCIDQDGALETAKPLSCWYDSFMKELRARRRMRIPPTDRIEVEAPELFMSVVVPSFNEEKRLEVMLAEAVEYLEQEYGEKASPKKRKQVNGKANGQAVSKSSRAKGWEVLIVSDGSTDNTENVALDFAKCLAPASRPHIRVVTLSKNRGKGGAVTHGLRHVRGEYAVFADADGASRFSDLSKLVSACEAAQVKDPLRRAIAVGSRAHLVGSEAVVKRSFLRNLLMHSFHLFLRVLTPPATARIGDTQCGFKLFSRESLPDIVPHMHSEGWIFDVEMLMLAESAKIPVVEVPVGWKEVGGSKLNVIWDSLGMAYGLGMLRAAWGLGIYSTD
jgi:dolichyl-phosphate beta-glucosyltransferase